MLLRRCWTAPCSARIGSLPRITRRALCDAKASSPKVEKGPEEISAARLRLRDLGRVAGHVGPMISLCGFMMSDVLYLRCMAIVASICGMTKNATYIPPNWDSFGWGIFFLGVNGYMIAKLLQERAAAVFSPDEMELYNEYFSPHNVSPTVFFKLMQISTWQRVDEGADGRVHPMDRRRVHAPVLRPGHADGRRAEGRLRQLVRCVSRVQRPHHKEWRRRAGAP